MATAADHTRGVLVMSYPKRTWWTRWAFAAGNLALRHSSREFQVFMHLPGDIGRTAELHGRRALSLRRGVFWEIGSWGRPAALPA